MLAMLTLSHMSLIILVPSHLYRHLPRLNPALQRVQGSLISMHIGEVAVEMRRNQDDKAL